MLINVLNADDHPILRKGVKDMIIAHEQFRWVGSAADGAEAKDKIIALQPDVALLDIEMPLLSGLEIAESIKGLGLPTKIIILTLYNDKAMFTRAMNTGIKGYILKDSTVKEIQDCIISVHKGIPYVNASLTKFLVDNKKSQNALEDLTKHEINILKLIAREKTTSEIANMLFLSPKTIANHRNNMSKKLKLNGIQNGLLKWALNHKDLLD